MMTPIEAKILATLELIHESLSELVTAANELVTVARKRQEVSKDKDNSYREVFSTFTAEVKPLIERLLTPPPQPFIDPPPMYKTRPLKREIKIIHLNDYIHNAPQLEIDLNKLLGGGMAEGNWILSGITDYHVMLHRLVEVDEVDAEFPDDGGKVNVQ